MQFHSDVYLYHHISDRHLHILSISSFLLCVSSLMVPVMSNVWGNHGSVPHFLGSLQNL